MKLKYRERQILQILLTKESVIGKELSEIFNISGRTIRNDIKNINLFLRSYSIEVTSNNNTGYSLKISQKERNMINELLKSDHVISRGEPEYREKYILIQLLANGWIDIYDLSDELYISSSSIIHDLRRIETKLSSVDKKFILHKKGSICSLEEKREKDIRLYLSYILIDKFNDLDVCILSEIIKYDVPFEKT